MGQSVTQNLEVCCGKGQAEQRLADDANTVDFGKSSPRNQYGRRKSSTSIRVQEIREVDHATLLWAVTRIQANFRGVKARKRLMKQSEVDMNSFHKSCLPGTEQSMIGTRQIVTKHVLPDGARYTGEVVIRERQNRITAVKEDVSVPQGKGKILWPNGDKYKGQFQEGIPFGEGMKTFSEDLSVLQGTFINGYAQGEGKLTKPGDTGFTYEGSFFGDKQDGFGREEWVNGTYYEGHFTKGKKGPKGMMKFGEGNVYEGEFKDNALHGKGKLTNETKMMCYDGEWKGNKMHGYGVYKWHDGRRYQGEYIDDKKHGFGAYMWVDGRIYYGMWKNGHQHGEGTIVLPNMSMKKSYWEAGKETSRLKLGDMEKEQIAKYVKEMQVENDADRRESSNARGRTSLQRKGSRDRRQLGVAQSQQLADLHNRGSNMQGNGRANNLGASDRVLMNN